MKLSEPKIVQTAGWTGGATQVRRLPSGKYEKYNSGFRRNYATEVQYRVVRPKIGV